MTAKTRHTQPNRRAWRWGWRPLLALAIGLGLSMLGLLLALGAAHVGLRRGVGEDDFFAACFMSALLLFAGGLTLYLAVRLARRPDATTGQIDLSTLTAVAIAHTLPATSGDSGSDSNSDVA